MVLIKELEEDIEVLVNVPKLVMVQIKTPNIF